MAVGAAIADIGASIVSMRVTAAIVFLFLALLTLIFSFVTSLGFILASTPVFIIVLSHLNVAAKDNITNQDVPLMTTA
ncbi:hypothetical protein D3C73_1560100 [compost metagenome]